MVNVLALIRLQAERICHCLIVEKFEGLCLGCQDCQLEPEGSELGADESEWRSFELSSGRTLDSSDEFLIA